MDLRARRRLGVVIIVIVISAGFFGLTTYAWRASRRYFPETGVVANKQQLLDRGSAYYICDSIAGHIHQPDVVIDVVWEEHPGGGFTMRTNNLGFREDAATSQAKPAGSIRVLVTGDSHIDGAVGNSESFPNQLEQLLNATYDVPEFEVDNGATGHYGPQNYVGFLRKYAYLEPDIYIVVFYTGNDFMDAIKIASWQDKSLSASLEMGRIQRLAYLGRLFAASRICHGGVSQALNSIFFFKHRPKMRETALAISCQQIEEIRGICLRTGIRLIVVLLPARAGIKPDVTDWRFNAARRLLSIRADDLVLSREMADSLAAWLTRSNINCVDLARCMEEDTGKDYFWEADYHLNHIGHRLAAEAVWSSCRPVFQMSTAGCRMPTYKK